MPHARSLSSTLSRALRLGEPTHFASLSLFPVFGPSPRVTYRGLSAALREGAVVEELRHASVNDVLFDNPGPLPTLLYEGESIAGAQQDRIIDGSTLVPADVTLPVSVCCVEAQRWQGSRHAEAFAVADHVASPDIRSRMKTTQRMNRAGRADQGAVWESVAKATSRHGVRKTTGAFAHVVEACRGRVEALVAVAELADDQLGWLVFQHDKFLAFDYVSRPEAWRDLSPSLLRGYALVADREASARPTPADAEAQLARLTELELEPTAGVPEPFNPKKTQRGGSFLAARPWGQAPNAGQPVDVVDQPLSDAISYRPRRTGSIDGTLLAASDEAIAVSFLAC